jgi:hypothetical protein
VDEGLCILRVMCADLVEYAKFKCGDKSSDDGKYARATLGAECSNAEGIPLPVVLQRALYEKYGGVQPRTAERVRLLCQFFN